jgi:hypothetical protein
MELPMSASRSRFLMIRRSTLFAVCVTITLLVAWACSRKTAPPSPTTSETAPTAAQPSATPPPVAPESRANQVVQAQMRTVLFRFSTSIAANIEFLNGEFLPTGNNPMPIFDDKTSFMVKVKSARISITPESLAAVMNTYVFSKANSPLKDLTVTIEGSDVRVKGKLHSKGDVPFETLGSLSPTKDGRIRIHSEKVKAFKIPVQGIMSLFGVELANVLDTSKVDGIDTDKNDLILDLARLLPPPHIQGVVTAVRVEDGKIVTIFGAAEKNDAWEKGNYMAFRGGRLRFGKITMENSDLSLFDLDPADPLDWFQDRYKDQLVSGYSKITPDFGLRTYVRDFAKISRASKTDQKPPAITPETAPATSPPPPSQH